MKYYVVQKTFKTDLEDEVNAMMDNGWEPLSGAQIIFLQKGEWHFHEYWMQTMVYKGE